MKRILTAIIALFSTFLLSAQIVVRTETGVYYLPIAEVDSITFDAFPKRYEYFSVGNGRYVAFSPGNLQCTGVKSGNYRWSFAPHQYDYIGASNINNSALADHIDLFGWSTTNTATPWGISTSEEANDYTGTFVDWGMNAIGYDAANTWRTLSANEWDYLFYTRANADLLFGLGSVNGVNGTIILPDNWVCPSGITFNPSTQKGLTDKGYYYYNPRGDNFSHNTYTLAEWQQLEQTGAVFLPACGYRYGTSTTYVSSQCAYWSSTPKATNYSCYFMSFKFSLYSQAVQSSFYGQSVRLVQDISNIHAITCASVNHGTISAERTSAKKGQTVTFTATPETGYAVSNITITAANGSTITPTATSIANQYTFTMPAANVTISATYIRIYTITCNTPTNGALTTDKTVCEENGTVTITATPNSGTKLQILTVIKSDGSIVTATAAGTDTYTFTMPASDVTISATYAYYFSISATQTVIFSRGNLQYQMRQGIWRFAKNQYDYIGKDNSQRKYTYSDTYIDLFGWGTGKNPTQNSSSNSDYSTFTDWGKNTIGSYPANTWRTLSQEEWQYLTKTRAGSQQRCGIATVNGIKGLIILPDVWNAPSGITFKYWYNSSYSENVYDIDQWRQMEAAGAVFLPNAGRISGSSYSDVGSVGYYWLSTENSTKAYQIQISSSSSFDGSTVCGYESMDKYYGASVRLVQTGLVQERQDFSITCTTPTNGTLSADKTTAERYDVVTITATPASGYALQSLKVLQGTKEITTTAAGTNTYTFAMPAGDVTISAIYSVPYSITCNTPTNGTLSVDKTTCAMTGTVTITTSPSTGYELESVKVMQGTTEITTTYITKNKRTFAMPDGDVTVTATFKALNYTITCTNPDNGALTADKTTGTIGETVTIKTTTTAGYRIKALSVMSGSTEITTKLTDTDTYTFTMPAGNVTITATTTIVTFSVSATERAVFAPGNLQYTQSTKKWSFAEHQYDILGTANVSGSALADKIDLFGWSTNNTTTAFGASNSSDATLYSGDFVDWGTNTIGDDAANTWRTPTRSQWDYLLNTRTDAASKYGVARIQLNDDGSEYANGVIILPDDWECPTGITFKSGIFTTTSDDDDSNATYDYAQYQTFTLAQWLQLEQAGAVFLPAAAYRTQNTTITKTHRGYYRTSTPGTAAGKAYMLRVCSNGVKTKEDVRYEGYSVRLLQITKQTVFSVSATKKVIFAPGNLQYTQSTKKWSFAEHQYDILGTANVSGSALADKIDLFGWSTNNSNTAFGVSSSKTTSEYNGSFVDWGTNAIGDYAANTWSTPTKDEFDYLLNTRTDAASKYGVARIYLNDDGSKYANGVIILPDDWTCPTGITFKSGTFTTTTDDDDSNATYDYAQYQTFTLAQWQQLEQAGAVFLPAAAFRKGTALDKSHRGYYRTSTPGTATNKAYMLRVCSNGIVTKEDVRREGYSVRLLQEVK